MTHLSSLAAGRRDEVYGVLITQNSQCVVELAQLYGAMRRQVSTLRGAFKEVSARE
jgi:hypothetical protein